MTHYFPVALYNLDGTFRAYAIIGEHKLQSTNIWVEGEETEFNERLALLNASSTLNQHWPHPQDPEVLEILGREDFMPVTYKEVQVVDENKSHYVYLQTTAKDKDGLFYAVDSDEIDEEASTIVYKTAQVPEQPTDTVARIRAACEIVAKERAGLGV
jgi:hypothetical protein